MSKCILCGGNSFKSLYASKNWEVEKCKKCGLVRTNRDKELDTAKYHRDEEYHLSEKQFENIFQKRVEIINKFFSKKGRVVEIGSSTGILLKLLKDEGWEVLGIEPSKSTDYAQEKGLETINKTFEEANLAKNKYDLVILNHTLEHVDNPLEVLRKIYSILKKRGIIFIDVPNFGSVSSILFRRRFSLLLPNEHNFHFTKATLEKLLKESKFKVKYFETRSGLFDYKSPILEIWMSFSSFKKRFFTNLIGLPLNIVEMLLNKGSAITVLGEK